MDHCSSAVNVLAQQKKERRGERDEGRKERKKGMLVVKFLTFPMSNGNISFCPTFRLEMEYDVIPSVSSIT